MEDAESKLESPLISSFRKYSEKMKNFQDKWERIFKLRRDITIQSKRVIFLLHTIDSDAKIEAVSKDARKRLQSLINNEYKKIAAEIIGEDPYMYYRAISPGNQEFVEALTLLEFLEAGEVKGLDSCEELPFIPTIDYILGIADLTGELMRFCISSVTMDHINYAEKVKQIRDFLRRVFIGMIGVTYGRDMHFKLATLESSLMKVERVDYSLHVLGNEVPKHILSIGLGCDDRDEGLG